MQSSTSTSTQKASLSVLVVEDNPVNRRVISLLLDHLGHRCQLVTNGREAVDTLTRSEPSYDLVLMDCHMPVLDGYAATREIRSLPVGASLPIIALTALNMPGDRERCIEAGMNGYVAKPVDTQVLVEEIERVLDLKVGDEVPLWAGPALEQLRQLGALQPGFTDELLTQYRADTSRLLGELQAAVSTKDQARVGRAGHELIGASEAVGAQRVADQCRTLKDSVAAGDFDGALRGLAALSHVIEQSIASFHDVLS